MKFRKKPVEVEAFMLGLDKEPYWFTTRMDIRYIYDEEGRTIGAIIPTLEGDHKAGIGDYIIQGVKGELYPCKPDIFEATYEPA